MKKLYLKLIIFVLIFCQASPTQAQRCLDLTASIQTSESRCASTGSIEITPSGGTGNYKYKVEGPVSTDFTTSSSITGLSAGIYTVIVNDIQSNCTYTKTGVIVTGSYQDPRFGLEGFNVTCDNGNNGSIKVYGLEHGIAPFSYTIVAPSPAGIGTTNNTGNFENLISGDYSIQLMDSCGGIQTRTVTINNYTWKIDKHTFTKFSCDSARGSIRASDNRGNVSTIDGIPGFHYGFITPTGDTTWSENAHFEIGAYGLQSVVLVAKDICGTVKTMTAPLSFTPSLDNNVSISDKVCKDFSAAVTGIKKFTNPTFSLYDGNDILLESNSSGKFTGLSYGKNYCIKALDECSGNEILRCFTEQPMPISIDKDVLISNKNCDGFDAKVTGLNGFTNPFFILTTQEGFILDISALGEFKGLAYGNYCIISRDGCRDTTITQCFTATPPVPWVDPIIIPSYVNCVDFGFEVGGDNLTLPRYCLYDTANVEIACNNTGIFDNILLGSYCVTIYDDCADTTFTRCFSVGPPVVPNDVIVDISDQVCDNFTASVTTQNFQNAAYCLYNQDHVLIRCDSSGVFSNLPYGTYYISSTSFCPDTTVITYFSASAPIPKIKATATMSNKTCSTFSARITGQENLTNPEYFLLDQNNQVIKSNTSGRFDNLLYGSYSIEMVNQCYDTTIRVAFSNAPNPINLKGTASMSCNYGTSKFVIKVTGNLPANVKIINPAGDIIYDITQSSGNHNVDNLPDLTVGKHYTIVAKDNCGNEKTMTLAPIAGYLNHSPTVSNKCPGSLWPNGSGNIHTTVNTNTGPLTVRIIKKDFISISPLVPNSTDGSIYSFTDLGPGSYIIRYNTNDGCTVYQYDTVTINPYAYPELTKSSAYQCDVNGFSVGAVVSNGVGPFSYSIIGSQPDAPSIISGPQPNPVFNIDNGNTYSLIRLRALDACGNATLGDASILPLASNKIIASANCFDYPVELTIDGMHNSSATWYKKDNLEDADSTEVGTGFNFYIERLLEQDTGIYICHLTVNRGCIERVYYIRINGDCYPALPVKLSNLEGRFEKNEVLLNWDITNGNNVANVIIQKKTTVGFQIIGEIEPENIEALKNYRFTDSNPVDQNYYRLKLIHKNNQITYSNTILLRKTDRKGINIFPNPVFDVVNIEFNKKDNRMYQVSLINVLNQKVKEVRLLNNGEKHAIQRTKEMTSGMYILHFSNLHTNEKFSYKIILK